MHRAWIRRLVRSTAKIKNSPAQRPQETGIVQALICVIVMRYAFFSECFDLGRREWAIMKIFAIPTLASRPTE